MDKLVSNALVLGRDGAWPLSPGRAAGSSCVALQSATSVHHSSTKHVGGDYCSVVQMGQMRLSYHLEPVPTARELSGKLEAQGASVPVTPPTQGSVGNGETQVWTPLEEEACYRQHTQAQCEVQGDLHEATQAS